MKYHRIGRFGALVALAMTKLLTENRSLDFSLTYYLLISSLASLDNSIIVAVALEATL